MYVIFPADEVVYLSYGRLIYVPKVQEVGNNTDIKKPPANIDTHQLTDGNSNPSVPSTSSSSTRSSRSVVASPILTSYSEDLQSDPRFQRGVSEIFQSSIKSNKSWPQTSTKYKKNCRKPQIRKDLLLERHTPNSNNKAKDFLELPFNESKSKSATPERKLSYLEYVKVYDNKSETTIQPLSKTNLIQEKLKNKNSKQLSNKKSFFIEDTPVNSDRNKKECEPEHFKELLYNLERKTLNLNAESRLQLTSLRQLPPEKTSLFKKKSIQNKTPIKMAGTDSPLRDLTHPSYNEPLKAHNAVTFKLVKTVSDFTQQLGQIYEQQAEELQLLVSNFKKKNLELRKERPACQSSLFHVWETLLQEVEIDSQALGDIASILGRQISRPLLERSFFRKIQSRKVFSHRESYETIITKTEEKLAKSRQEYKAAYLTYLSTPTTESLSAYFNNHNAYVQQLHATNGMLDAYANETFPQLLQKELFLNKLESNDSTRERKMSLVSTGSMKNKWLKAFKSLKTPPPSASPKETEKKNGSAANRDIPRNDADAHNFQEYTYKKITPCDVCSQILRGHTRQGLKCRFCKMNVHVDCQDKASKCQPKSRLLRRQKSTSEIESRVAESTVEEESLEDEPFTRMATINRQLSFKDNTKPPLENLIVPARSRPPYNCIARSSIKARSTPSSPVHNRRLLSAKNIRMSSVELPDDNDKSPSSASTSPCPSPVGAKKAHRLLPTNLYVVLYNFKSRHQDELDLKAGDKVTVIDFSDPDWWKGKSFGRVGYFPSKYCSKLAAGEKPLQVTHNLQLSDGDNGLMLLRDQIVIQIGEEIDGMVMIRSGDNRQGVCPVKFLQEV
ncbi:hypothetical protein FQA39_LY09981 [Lamprigera yunnana]|nr:hypothetical protein FQA39_LY09981 [Lamprigera yunnana]